MRNKSVKIFLACMIIGLIAGFVYAGAKKVTRTDAMEPAFIPASEIHKEVLSTPECSKLECVYTGISNTPPWELNGRDAPWSTDVRVGDVYDEDDQLLSMAEDALGRIYVVYETIYTSAGGGRYGWGIATSTDNGASWDNRVLYLTDYSIRYPEITISDDGRIFIFGSRSGVTYSNNVCFTKSPIGSYNDPGVLASIWTFGALPERTYAECVSWGNGVEFICAQYTVDQTGNNDSICVIYAQDGLEGGSAMVFTLQPSGGYTEKASISVDVVGTDTILTHGIEYYDAAGSDWDVVCYLDTLNGSGGLYGWGTTNTLHDRYPSVFASGGYAYIAYEANVGFGDDEIFFNYSTDYGQNWAGSMTNLTNDVAFDAYPRLYGDDQTIGVVYFHGNRVYYNYSVDNGITWLGTPEIVDDNSTVSGSYHSIALLYASGYWSAAWEDTRNNATDGIEIYTSGKNAGQGDILHRPEILTFNYDWSFFGDVSAKKYVQNRREQPIDEKLSRIIAESSQNEQIPVFVMMAKQFNYDWLMPKVEQMSKADRRQFVIQECKELAQNDQYGLLNYLRSMEKTGRVTEIQSLWVTNTVAFWAYPEIIQEVAQRPDVWCIGFEEKAQIIDVVNDPDPSYEHINFVAENGREICWGVAKINADDVWTDYTGAGIVVGHMDTGVNYNHGDLADHMWDGSGAGYPHHGYDWAATPDDDDPMDENGHGTQTAGIVAGDGTNGSNTGVALDAQIMALRVATNIDMGNAIAFGLTNGADLFSTSLGFENPDASIKNWSRGQANTIYAAGLVMCVAAGNGRSVPPYGHYTVPQDIVSPADCPAPWYAPNGGNSASMAVGATDPSDDIASWSSYGPTAWSTGTWNDYPYPPGLMKPDVSAPGDGCKSLDHLTTTGYDNGISGTSFAQPHLAGTIALMLEKEPSLLPRQIDSIIQNHAVVDIETAGRDSLSGAGRIDALLAVNAVSSGYRAKTVWIINQATATGHLQVTDITQTQSEPWIVVVTPKQFSVPIDDSVAVTVGVDTTGLWVTQGETLFDTLYVHSNTVFDNTTDSIPVILIMATIGVEEQVELLPTPGSRLLSVLPNPFKTQAQVELAMSIPGKLYVAIYDVTGQHIKTLANDRYDAGFHTIAWNGTDDMGKRVPAGIYFCRAMTPEKTETNKMIFIR